MTINLTIKTIEHKGVKVTYAIDFDRKTVSLVERNGNDWQNKRWVFPERQPKYLDSWIIIMEAMQEAVKQAKSELNAHIEKEGDELAKKVFKERDDML